MELEELLADLDPESRALVASAHAADAAVMAAWYEDQARLADAVAERSAAWGPAWESVLRAASTQGL